MPRSFWMGALSVPAVALAAFPRHAAADTLFSDNYETVANGGNDVENGDDPSTGTPPNVTPLHADVGSYLDAESNGRVIAYGAAISNPTNNSVNVNAPAATDTGGLDLLRLQPPSGGSRTDGRLSQPASVQGSTFHMEFDLYSSSNVSFGFGSQNPGEFGLRSGLSSTGNGNTRPAQSFIANLANGTISVQQDTDHDPTTGNAVVQTGLTFTTNTFQHYAIDYVIGSDELTLTQTKSVDDTPTTSSVVITNPFLSTTDSDFNSNNGLTPVAVPKITQVDTIFFSTGSAGAAGFVDNLVATGSAFAGDANHDGIVNALDFNALASNFGIQSTAQADVAWSQGDFNADGKVDTADFDMLANNFSNTLPSPAPAGALVPEPMTLGLFGFTCLLAIRRTKRARISI